MNHRISHTLKGMLLFLACLTIAGCGQEEMPTPDAPDEHKPQVVLTFSASSGLVTRTQLPGTDNLQHVQRMQLYIFDGTGNDALCVASEVVDWTDLAAPQGKPTVTKKHEVRYAGFTPGKPYTFLAVGMDDCSPTTYGLPGAVVLNQTKLADAKAVLDMAGGKDRNDIAVSELFGGSLVLTPAAAGQVTGTIDLFRRVAGVMGWFKNLPKQVNGRDVASLRIELYKAQNKSIWLTKPQSGADVIMEPIEENDDNKILVKIDLKDTDFGPETVVSKGSYVLPMIAPFATADEMTEAGYADESIYVKDYTLRVVLAAADGTVLQEKRVKNNDTEMDDTMGGTGIIIPGDAFRFPINANWFYPIGRADKPVIWPEEEGSNIVITVCPNWDWKGNLEWAD